jgi:beta-lactamase regulating signal transducer with metallopeptidase domain
MLRHELFHGKENHSLDILLPEVLAVIQWFNPFIYLIRRELKAIHESVISITNRMRNICTTTRIRKK